MALGRHPDDRDDVDIEAIAKWPNPPSSLTSLDEIDPTLWPEHEKHRQREIEEARLRALSKKETARG